MLLLYTAAFLIDGMTHGYRMTTEETFILAMVAVIICGMACFCFVVCKFLLRFRIREIVNKSIIDNIREL